MFILANKNVVWKGPLVLQDRASLAGHPADIGKRKNPDLLDADNKMTTELEKENTLRALKGEAIAKVCVECVHYSRPNSMDYCLRKVKSGFHNVTGKVQEIGEKLYCDIEREIESAAPTRVANEQQCGAIGQFWEQAPPKPSVRLKWFQKLGFFKAITS